MKRFVQIVLKAQNVDITQYISTGSIYHMKVVSLNKIIVITFVQNNKFIRFFTHHFTKYKIFI